VSAVAAVPLMAIGASGAVVGEIGEELWESVTSDDPFDISDEIITAGPPPQIKPWVYKERKHFKESIR